MKQIRQQLENSQTGKFVFNRTITLKHVWAKKAQKIN
jgi:hypothetical protein